MTDDEAEYNRDAYGTPLGKPYRARGPVGLDPYQFDSWLAGYLASHPQSSQLEAVMVWLDQEQLEQLALELRPSGEAGKQ